MVSCLNKQIVLIVENRLTTRDINRYGIDTFLSYGCEVTVVDITTLSMPGFPKTKIIESDSFKQIIVSKKADLPAVQKLLSTSDLAILRFGSSGVTARTLPVFKCISDSGVVTLALCVEITPTSTPKRSFSQILLEILLEYVKKLKRGQVRLGDSILSKLPISVLGISTLDYVVYGGTKTHNRSYTTKGPKTKAIYAHSLDYDLLKDNKTQIDLDQKYVVFIDQNWPYHQDFVLNNFEINESSESYHDALRAFFLHIQRETGFDVVVSAHPRADMAIIESAYEGYRVVRGQTPQLVLKSQFVVAHYSTAVGLGVLCKKPILLIATAAMLKNPHMTNFFKGLSKALDDNILLIDVPDIQFDFAHFLLQDRTDTYQNFVNQYIKQSGSSKDRFWDIVFKSIFLH